MLEGGFVLAVQLLQGHHREQVTFRLRHIVLLNLVSAFERGLTPPLAICLIDGFGVLRRESAEGWVARGKESTTQRRFK